MLENHARALITSTDVAILKDDGELEIYKVSDFGDDFTITKEQWQKYSALAQWLGSILVALLIFIVSWFLLVMSACLWGLVGRLIAVFFRASLDYPALVRLASISSIPVWSFAAIFGRLGLHSWSTVFGLQLAYMIFAVRANR
jgi:hypothetical protein